MINRIKLKKLCLLGLVLLLIGGGVPLTVKGGEVDHIEQAKNGIIGIKSGFTDKSGRFHMLKSSSGILICNQEGNTYVVTTYHSVAVTNEEKASYCEEKEIAAEENDLTNTIRIMIKGDVDVDVSVLTESEVQDYCILNVANVINEKSALRLGDVSDLKIGDPVYALGFSEDAAENNTTQYAADEVEIHMGNIQDTSASIGDAEWVQHSGVINYGNSGGALLDAEGYLIGLNNEKYTDSEINACYSLAINEIKEILDNYGIFYESKERDRALSELEKCYKRCTDLAESGQYKGESLEVLKQNLETVKNMIEESALSLEAIDNSIYLLEDSESKLEKKMPLSRKIVYVLGVCCILLLGRLIQLIVVIRKTSAAKEKKECIKEKSGKKLEDKKPGKERSTKSESQSTVPGRKIQGDCSRTISVEHIEKEENTALLFQDEAEGDKTEVYNPTEDIFFRNAKKAELEQQRTGQMILITKPDFYLGKKPDMVDYAITDNKVVSRLHASINWVDGEYFIQDRESVNGTFVNGKQIGTEEVLLKNGDEIALANEIFIIKIEG